MGARRCAAQLVAELLGHDGHVEPARVEAGRHAVLEHPSQLELGQPYVAERVVLHRSQRRGIELLGQAFGEDRHTVIAAQRPALDDGALQDVGQTVEAHGLVTELFGDDGQRGCGRAADAEREMTGVAAHHGDEDPALGRGGVLHQVADELLAQVRRRREPERDDVAGQGEIVVDRLRHVRDREAGQHLGELGGGVGGVVAADGDQVVDAQFLERRGHTLDSVGCARGIRPRRAQDGAALEVDTREIVDAQLDDVSRVALGQPAKAVVTPEDTDAVIARLDGRGRDDGVDTGCGAAADENAQSLSGARYHSTSLLRR